MVASKRAAQIGAGGSHDAHGTLRSAGNRVPDLRFSHCRDVVAAVSRAGGFGVLGALSFTPEELEIELKWIDEHVDGKPYGVDLVMPAKYGGKGVRPRNSKAQAGAMIPQEHWDWVDKILAEYDMPPLPEESSGGHRLLGWTEATARPQSTSR